MSKALIADTRPAVLELEPGVHWWCSCGRSAGQPFCDGSHKGTGLSPVRFETTERQRIALCNCKQTSTHPHCDGSHSRISR
jgi:CDGSH iron-sulfur domain-containing protein 3